MAGKICNARGHLPGDYGPLINQSERAYYRSHIIILNEKRLFFFSLRPSPFHLFFSFLTSSDRPRFSRFQKKKKKARGIDHFEVTDAILQGVQNYWGERKIDSKCMEKVGSFDAR